MTAVPQAPGSIGQKQGDGMAVQQGQVVQENVLTWIVPKIQATMVPLRLHCELPVSTTVAVPVTPQDDDPPQVRVVGQSGIPEEAFFFDSSSGCFESSSSTVRGAPEVTSVCGWQKPPSLSGASSPAIVPAASSPQSPIKKTHLFIFSLPFDCESVISVRNH